MKKYRYNIKGLECANCARKLEDNLNKNNKFNNVIVNFSTSKLSYDSDESLDINELNKIIRNIDEDALVYDSNSVKENKEYNIFYLIIGLVLGIVGMYTKLPFKLNMILLLLSYAILLYRPFINAIKTLIKSKSINENALIVISCVGAFLVNQHMEGIMVIALYLIGKMLEEKAINNTRKSISDLVNIKQNYANKKQGKELIKINVEDVLVNDILIIKKGERIPTDGIVIKGSTKLDTSALTGESELREVKEKDIVLSGTINIEDVIEIKATSLFSDSTVSRILELLEEATDKKSKTETFVSKASKVYTPSVLILAIIVAILLPLIINITYSESIYRALTFLVISCPCAIAISVPLSYFTGIGVSSKNGILVKGSNYLDNLSHINKIVFDKTGTLTNSTFTIKEIKILDKKYTKEEVIEILRKGESFSNHPIAKSIMKLSDKKVVNSDVKNYKEIEGKGITFKLNNNDIKIGNNKLCECNEIADLHLNINNKHIASIFIDNGIKEDAHNTIEELKKFGIKTYMFTGDKKEIANEIGKSLNIDEIKYEMLPTDKYKEYENISNSGDVIAFVGDGINDAPVLRRSDIGISMGNIGSSSAIEASDVVIMNDDLIRIPKVINISRYTKKIIKQNLIFALSVKFIVLILSITGIATMWSAVFADTGVTVLTILNTLKIIKKFK